MQLFSLLKQNPGLLELIAAIMGTAPRLARILSKRRRVLDAVLDAGLLRQPARARRASMPLIAAEFEGAADFQEVLDRARLFASEQAFLIGVRVLTGTICAAQAGGAYALLAECIDRGHAGRGGARDGAGARPRAGRRRGRRRHGQARRARDDGRLRPRPHR